MQTDKLLNFEKIEVRKEEGKPTEIFGYGAVFNSPSIVMRTARGEQFIEKIERGAFDHLLDDDGIMVLFNHDDNFPLGRNKRSATIGVDAKGLWYRFVAPNSPMGQNIQESIERGDIRASSFSFAPPSAENERWERRKNEPHIRTIIKFDRVVDLGPVTYEAYPETMVTTRNYSGLDAVKDEDLIKDLAEMELDTMKRDLKIK